MEDDAGGDLQLSLLSLLGEWRRSVTRSGVIPNDSANQGCEGRGMKMMGAALEKRDSKGQRCGVQADAQHS